ncbi:MAG: hypothetical protein ACRDZ4_09230 [Egibacteraceae bacterium]
MSRESISQWVALASAVVTLVVTTVGLFVLVSNTQRAHAERDKLKQEIDQLRREAAEAAPRLSVYYVSINDIVKASQPERGDPLAGYRYWEAPRVLLEFPAKGKDWDWVPEETEWLNLAADPSCGCAGFEDAYREATTYLAVQNLGGRAAEDVQLRVDRLVTKGAVDFFPGDDPAELNLQKHGTVSSEIVRLGTMEVGHSLLIPLFRYARAQFGGNEHSQYSNLIYGGMYVPRQLTFSDYLENGSAVAVPIRRMLEHPFVGLQADIEIRG